MSFPGDRSSGHGAFVSYNMDIPKCASGIKMLGLIFTVRKGIIVD